MVTCFFVICAALTEGSNFDHGKEILEGSTCCSGAPRLPRREVEGKS
jgi:hypothetical protein